MRRILVIAAVGALALSACSEAEEAISQASEQVQEVAQTAQYCYHAFEVSEAIEAQDLDRAISAGEELVATAPAEIEATAATLLEAARQAAEGDLTVLQDEEVQREAQYLEEFTRDTCDPTS